MKTDTSYLSSGAVLALQIHAFSLKFDDEYSIKSEFTLPVPIRRYFTCGRNEEVFEFRFGSSFISEDPSREILINQIVDTLYPFENYRMLMSFVRTSPLKTPIRVEFLEQGGEDNWKEVLASIYISSLPCMVCLFEGGGEVIFVFSRRRNENKVTTTRLIR